MSRIKPDPYSMDSRDISRQDVAGDLSPDCEASDAFWAAVCHELRTPLTSLLGFSALGKKGFERTFLPLAQDDQTLERGRKILRNLTMIEQAGWRLARLVSDVQDLHRIQSGRMQWHDEDVAVQEVIAKTLHQVQPLYEAKPEVRLQVNISESLPILRIDQERLIQVLANLLSNAVRFTPSGHVTLDVGQDEGLVRIQVRDSGVGIAADELVAVFLPFHQSPQDKEENIPRETGLGLAICKGIVEHYQGSIRADSIPGQGSTFTIFLPVRNPAGRCDEEIGLGA